MGRIVLSIHARERMAERNITLRHIEQVISQPDEPVEIGSKGELKATKGIRKRIIRVVYRLIPDGYYIITVMANPRKRLRKARRRK